MFNRERFISGVRSGAEIIVQQAGIAAQTVAERLREPLQLVVGRIRSNYEHYDLRGRKRLGYAGITAAATGVGILGVLLGETLSPIPGNPWSWINIWGTVPASSVTCWALLELKDAIIDRIQARHTPTS